jgi:hypothetical protein
LKDNTEVYNLQFTTEKNIKIKIEVDTLPPLGFETEHKLLTLPFSFMCHCYTPELIADFILKWGINGSTDYYAPCFHEKVFSFNAKQCFHFPDFDLSQDQAFSFKVDFMLFQNDTVKSLFINSVF